MRSLTHCRNGATAVEFALIAPFYFVMMFGTIAMGITIWSSTVLNEVAAEAARCLAIGGPACIVRPAGCASRPAICFVIRLADERGSAGLTEADIRIESAVSTGAVSATRVTLTRPFALAGYSMTISGSASYPNN